MVLACWDRTASRYGQAGPPIFRLSAERLLALLDPEPGSRLLDVACGRGAVAVLAAQKVSPVGQVVATDYSACMVEEAKKEAERAGLTNITCAQMDAQSHDFPDESFHFVTCAFALFFFPDISKSLAEMHRLLVPGGKIGLSLWGRGAIVPIWPILGEVAKEFDLRPVIPHPIAWKGEEVKALLSSAGFSSAETIEERYDFSFPQAEEAWEFTRSIGPVEVMLEQLPEAKRREFLATYHSRLQAPATGEGIPANFRVLYALAVKGAP